MLCTRVTRDQAEGTTKSEFRMFQSPTFPTVVFTSAEMLYWQPDALPRSPFFPTLMHLCSAWERHIVLQRQPAANQLVLAPRKADWQKSLSKALKECHADLRSDMPRDIAAREWWTRFIGSSELDGRPASGLFVMPGPEFVAQFSHFAPLPWHLPVYTGDEMVQAASHVARPTPSYCILPLASLQAPPASSSARTAPRAVFATASSLRLP